MSFNIQVIKRTMSLYKNILQVEIYSEVVCKLKELMSKIIITMPKNLQ